MTFIPAVLAFPLMGGSFSILNAVQTGLTTIEVTFSEGPTASDPTGTNDALNPDNWTITGPALNAVQSVTLIDTDTVQLNLYYPLKVGFWTAAGSVSIHSLGGVPLGSPKEWSFYVASAYSRETPEKGAENDTAYDVLRKFFNPALKGTVWENLLRAFSVGEQLNYDNTRYAYDQYHICSASSSFLVQRASDQGVEKPWSVGLSDENFRNYTISLKNRRLTEDAILRILEVFYGTDSIHAYMVSGLAEPYDIETGDTLRLVVNGKQEIEISFDASGFGIPHQAKALELAVQCNQAFEENDVKAYAIGYSDPVDGSTKLKLYSSSQGLGSSLLCVGGTAQNQLQFDSLLDVYNSGSLPTWVVDYNPATRTTSFTATNPDVDYPDMSLVQEGDYVNILGTEFSAANRGSYTISHVGYQYSVADPPVLTVSFTVDNENGVDESVTQLAESSLLFFRPTKADTHTTLSQTVTVSGIDGQIRVTIPSTSTAVSRSELTGSYLHSPTSYPVTYTISNGQLTLNVPNLAVGSTVFLDPTEQTFASPPVNTTLGKTNYSYLSTWTESSLLNGNRMGHVQVPLANRTLTFGGEVPSTLTPPTYHTNAEITTYSVGTITSGGVTYPQVTFASSNIVEAGYSWGQGFPADSTLLAYGYPADSAFLFGGIAAATNLPSSKFIFLDGVGLTTSGDTMTVARALHRATQNETHSHGYGLITGGMTSWQVATKTAEIFNPTVAGSFSATNPMTYARAEHSQTRLSNDFVLVTGGRPMATGPFVDSATVALWRLDDSAVTPSDSGPNSLTLTPTVATLTTDQTVNSKGAITWNGTTTALTRAATPVLQTTFTSTAYTVQGWFKYATLNTYPIFAYTGASTPAVTADNILFGFGFDPANAGNLIVYYDDSTTARVSLTVSTASFGGLVSGWNHWAVTCQPGTVSGVKFILYINGVSVQSWDNRVATSGGGNATLSIGYEPNAGYVNQHWNGMQSQIKVSSVTLSAAEIWRSYLSGTGEAYYYKRASDSLIRSRMGLALNSCELFNPDTHLWSTVGSMSSARFGHKAILLPSGEVLVVGGYGYPANKLGVGDTCQPVKNAEIWSPTTNRWRPAGKTPFGGFVWAETIGDKVFVGSAGQVVVFNTKTYTWSNSFAYGNGFEGLQSSKMGDTALFVNGGFTLQDIGSLLTDNESIFVQNQNSWYGGANVGKMYTVSSSNVSSSTLSTEVPGYGAGTGTLTLAKATASAHPKGPFLTDKVKGWAVTETKTALSTKIAGGHKYPFIDVADTTGIGDGDYVIIGFGYNFQTNPLKVLYVASATQLAIDATYLFPEDIEVGSSVIKLYSKDPYVFPPTSGQFYLTDSPAGRVAAQKAVQESVAAGYPLNLKVQYPGDRGLGNEGYPTQGNYKLSDIVPVFAGSDDTDQEIQDERDRVNPDA